MIIEPAWDRSGEYWACAQEGAFIFALSYITVVHDYCVVSVSLVFRCGADTWCEESQCHRGIRGIGVEPSG